MHDQFNYRLMSKRRKRVNISNEFIGAIIPDQKVYKAANLYIEGEFEKSQEVLSFLGDDETKHIFEVLEKKRAWKEDDDGYSFFLEAVNEQLGQPVYLPEDDDEDDDKDD